MLYLYRRFCAGRLGAAIRTRVHGERSRLCFECSRAQRQPHLRGGKVTSLVYLVVVGEEYGTIKVLVCTSAPTARSASVTPVRHNIQFGHLRDERRFR